MKSALFDFAGTLAELCPRRESLMLDLLAAKGSHPEEAAIVRAFRSADTLLPYSSIKLTDERARVHFYLQYNACVATLLGVGHLLSSAEIYDHFTATERHWTLHPRTRELLLLCRELGYSTAILSNFDEVLETLARDTLGLDSVIDDVVASQAIGLEKPDLRFFGHYLSRFDVDLPKSMYVGDSYPLDYVPARELGLRTFLVDPLGDFQHLPGRLGDLGELANQLS